MTKTVKIKELYDFIRASNMMGYIESEEGLIRMIKKMVEGKAAKAMYFEFFNVDGETLTFKIHLKNLEN